jgi:hypothetical protein
MIQCDDVPLCLIVSSRAKIVLSISGMIDADFGIVGCVDVADLEMMEMTIFCRDAKEERAERTSFCSLHYIRSRFFQNAGGFWTNFLKDRRNSLQARAYSSATWETTPICLLIHPSISIW